MNQLVVPTKYHRRLLLGKGRLRSKAAYEAGANAASLNCVLLSLKERKREGEWGQSDCFHVHMAKVALNTAFISLRVEFTMTPRNLSTGY